MWIARQTEALTPCSAFFRQAVITPAMPQFTSRCLIAGHSVSTLKLHRAICSHRCIH
jgi:hypothetical protein